MGLVVLMCVDKIDDNGSNQTDKLRCVALIIQ